MRYVGEAIVAVVATSRYLAEDALELIEIEFEPLGAVSRSEQAVAEDAPLLHEEAGTNVLIAREFKKGDVEADLKNAAVRVSGRFEMTRKAPLAMEPRSYTAEYNARRGAITLYTSSNIPGIVRDAISEIPRPSRQPLAGGRTRRRRKLRIEGLALSGGAFDLHRGAQARSLASNGPQTAWRTSAAAVRRLVRSSMPRWDSTRTVSP